MLGKEYRPFSSSLCNFFHSPVSSSLLGPLLIGYTEYIYELKVRKGLRNSSPGRGENYIMRSFKIYEHPSSNVCKMFELRLMKLLKYGAFAVKM
jgi:hypothetical protein